MMLFFRGGGSGGSGKRMLLSSLSVGIWWMGVFVVVAGRAGDSWDAWMFGSLLRVSPDVRVGSVETAELLAGISVSMKGIMCGRFGGSLVPHCRLIGERLVLLVWSFELLGSGQRNGVCLCVIFVVLVLFLNVYRLGCHPRLSLVLRRMVFRIVIIFHPRLRGTHPRLLHCFTFCVCIPQVDTVAEDVY